MATSATIIVKRTDGKYKAVYLNWDGYQSYVVPILLEHYNSQELAEALVAPGDLSVLAPSCEKPEGHTFESPVPGHCIYYGRDRGETGVDGCVAETASLALMKMGSVYRLKMNSFMWEDGAWSVNGRVLKEPELKLGTVHRIGGGGDDQ